MGYKPADTFHRPEPAWNKARGDRMLIAGTVFAVIVSLLVPLSWQGNAVAWVLFFAYWALRRTHLYVYERRDRAGCRCCRDRYPVIWVEPIMLIPRYGVRSACTPEFNLCKTHKSQWLRIVDLERQLLPLEGNDGF